MTWKALLFDLDGTLIDSLGDLHAAVNRALARFDRGPLDLAQVRRFIGDGMPQLIRRCLDAGEGAVPALEDVVEAFRADYAEHCLDRTTWFAGIDELLDSLSAKLAIVSNKPTPFCLEIVKGLDPKGRFAVVIGAEGEKRKPSPEPLFDALKVMGARPEEALMIGDGIPDLRAARRAGCASCAVTWGMDDEAELRAEKPDHLVRSVSELATLLLGLT